MGAFFVNVCLQGGFRRDTIARKKAAAGRKACAGGRKGLPMDKNNKIRLVASDLDGTLLQNGNTHVSDEFLGMIPKLMKKDILFCAASGRSYDNLRLLFEPVRDDIAYICDNGSVGYYRGQRIYENALDGEMCARILERTAQLEDCDAFVACARGVFTDSGQEDFWQFMRENSYGMMQMVPDLRKMKEPLYKIALFSRTHTDELAAYFQEFCQGRILAKKTAAVWVDFINPAATKGDALRALGQFFRVSAEETMAFGDRFNDVEMLEYAGLSYVVENAEEGLAEHANGVTPTVEDVVRKLVDQ